MSLLDDLSWRGLIHQVSHESELRAAVAAGPMTLYLGIDPTGPSLHIGHLLPLMVLRRFHQAGHKIVALVGGGTAMIGDPSGKSAERNLQTREMIAHNADQIRVQVESLIGSGDRVIHADNWDWLSQLALIPFLRDIGKYFSVNAMIQKDSVRTRIEREGEGISFTEFTYQLLQGYDFLELYRRHGCTLQIGGSDQWGNIVGGADLIRRLDGGKAFALTIPLLTDANGNKFGKTEQGAVFLNPAMTSPFRFYQFWVNQPDGETVKLLKLFTDLDQGTIAGLEAGLGSPDRPAQKRLAQIMTDLIHGPAATERAIRASEIAFYGDLAGIELDLLDEIFADLPACTVTPAELTAGLALVDLLVQAGACESKADARRQLQQNAVKLNRQPPAAGLETRVTAADFLHGRVLLLARGKRNNYLVKITDGA